ncbi:MAG: HD domain-containing protein, partial [Spirochaetales bacterium]|nr:HD domain-containing protein [Spirochaetales bacterium]
ALKLAAMLHDIGKVESISINPKANYPKYPNHANLSANIAKRYLKDILRFFPFYSQLLEKVTFLIENHMKIAFLPDLEEDKKKDILNSVYLNDLLKLLKADLNASSADLNIYKRVYSYIQKLKI